MKTLRTCLLVTIALMLWAVTASAQSEVTIPLTNKAVVSNATHQTQQRYLLKFNLPDKLTGVQIDYAKLRIKVKRTTNEENPEKLGVAIAAVTTNWSGNQVSWDADWSEPGGDFAPEYSWHVFVGESPEISEFLVTETIQAWVDGDISNFGFIVMSNYEDEEKLELDSSPGLPSGAEAELVIRYTADDPNTDSN